MAKEIISIEEIEYEGDVYNLHVENNHNYFANNCNVSNCHKFAANSLIDIMTKLTNATYRFGFTGTLNEDILSQMTLKGLFGNIKKTITTRELMDSGRVAELDLKVVVLKYPTDECKLIHKKDKSIIETPTSRYKREVDFLCGHDKRNNFISNLALKLEGNTLILYRYVESHGEILYDLIKSKNTKNRDIFFIHGGVNSNEREDMRSIVEKADNAIIIGSLGTLSTGINIRNIDNIVIAFPLKGKITLLQSIGRGLRISDRKSKCFVYDIGDDLRHGQKENIVYRHLIDRCTIYAKEQFNFKTINLEI